MTDSLILSLPANQQCLSPLFVLASNRPVLIEEEIDITNTTIFIFWETLAPLQSLCEGIVFSIPPYTYVVYESVSGILLFNTVSCKSHIICSMYKDKSLSLYLAASMGT